MKSGRTVNENRRNLLQSVWARDWRRRIRLRLPWARSASEGISDSALSGKKRLRSYPISSFPVRIKWESRHGAGQSTLVRHRLSVQGGRRYQRTSRTCQRRNTSIHWHGDCLSHSRWTVSRHLPSAGKSNPEKPLITNGTSLKRYRIGNHSHSGLSGQPRHTGLYH